MTESWVNRIGLQANGKPKSYGELHSLLYNCCEAILRKEGAHVADVNRVDQKYLYGGVGEAPVEEREAAIQLKKLLGRLKMGDNTLDELEDEIGDCERIINGVPINVHRVVKGGFFDEEMLKEPVLGPPETIKPFENLFETVKYAITNESARVR